MRFRRFRHHERQPASPAGPTEPRAWKDSGLADEVEAWLAGRYVDHLSGQGHVVPVWSVLNRLAHADHAVLVRLVEGDAADPSPYGTRKAHPWAIAERFIAAHLLATRGATPEGLDRVQQSVLVPLELALMARTRYEKMTPDEVLEAGSQALDSYRTGA